MMSGNVRATWNPALSAAVSAGALWGIFESTAGYILHLLPVSVGFLVWYPAACFFLTKAFRGSGKPYAVLLTAALAAVVKLSNLLLPGPVDRVLNPAVSIVFEGFAIFTAICVIRCMSPVTRKNRWVPAALSLGANSLWRLMYIVYLAAVVPQWMRDTSVLRSVDALFRFLVVDNLAGSAVAWFGFQLWKRISGKSAPTAEKAPKTLKAGRSGVFLLLDIGLQFLLK